VPILLALFLVIFAIVRALVQWRRHKPLGGWFVGWLVGLGVGLLTVLAIQFLRPSLFVVLVYRYWKGWPSYLPVSMLGIVGIVLTFVGAVLIWLLLWVLVTTLTTPKPAPKAGQV
jgi:predicted branched-subunit amino acid permease